MDSETKAIRHDRLIGMKYGWAEYVPADTPCDRRNRIGEELIAAYILGYEMARDDDDKTYPSELLQAAIDRIVGEDVA